MRGPVTSRRRGRHATERNGQRHIHAGEIHRVTTAVECLRHGIDAECGSKSERVIPGPAGKRVVARAATDQVDAALATDRVAARISLEQVSRR